MYYNLIKNYVNKLSIEDVIMYSKKENIILSTEELKFIYNCIKNKWVDIYNGNTYEIFNNAKILLKEETYNKIVKLYEEKRKLL